MAGLDSRLVPKGRDSRRAERLPLSFPASLREPGSTKFSVEVRDLSVSGFRCDTSFSLTVGSRVWLTIPGIEALEAQVMWREQWCYGFAFTAPLHPAVLDHVALRQRRKQLALERAQRAGKLSGAS